jgi:hypothetical protein
MPKKSPTSDKTPFYLKQLKDGRWTVFDQQQRMHGGTHTAKADAETVLARLLAEHTKGKTT